MLSILPRFVALEMIADMSALEDELNPHEFHKIYIHQYKDVRYKHTQCEHVGIYKRILGNNCLLDGSYFNVSKDFTGLI